MRSFDNCGISILLFLYESVSPINIKLFVRVKG